LRISAAEEKLPYCGSRVTSWELLALYLFLLDVLGARNVGAFPNGPERRYPNRTELSFPRLPKNGYWDLRGRSIEIERQRSHGSTHHASTSRQPCTEIWA
jgi:hypothetical protein